jgi:ATP-dependent Clp protease ATP-binding subunit ClpC
MPGPFDRFDNDSKRALALAQSEAVRLGHTWLGTEHLMLALVHVGGVATAALTSCGVDLGTTRAAVVQVLPRVDGSPTEVRLTPRMKSVIERAQRLADERATALITPPVLLLALVADPYGVGTQVLTQLGATPEKVREAVDRLTPPS